MESDRRALIQLDSEFHTLLNKSARNQVLAKVADLMKNQLMRLWFYVSDIDDKKGYWENILADRERLIDALQSRDAKAVSNLLKHQILQFIERVRQTISD